MEVHEEQSLESVVISQPEQSELPKSELELKCNARDAMILWNCALASIN
jgi:hypothetical protein